MFKKRISVSFVDIFFTIITTQYKSEYFFNAIHTKGLQRRALIIGN